MVADWCNRIIRAGFLVLLFLVPLILTPWNYELFEFNKMMVTYAVTVVVVTAWIVRMVSEREIRIARTPLNIPILLFVLSQFISALYSIDPHVSWFGYYSRFNGGMWSVISYTLLFFVFVSTDFDSSQSSDTSSRIKGFVLSIKEKSKKQQEPSSESSSIIRNTYPILLLKVALITASIVSLYGILERLGIDKQLWVQDVQNRVFSTLGQPNWLAAYLVVLYPVALGFAVRQLADGIDRTRRRAVFSFWTAVAFLFFIVLIFTRSRSGLFGIAVASLIFWPAMWLTLQNVRPRILKFFVGIHLVFFLFLFFNGSYVHQFDQYLTLKGLRARFSAQQNEESPETQPATDTLLVTGGTESGTIRSYVWKGALTAWKSTTKTFLIGTGTETFAFAFYQFKPKEHNLTSEWDFLYNKAHNEYLNYLATTGILGLGSYLFFIGVFILWFIKKHGSMIPWFHGYKTKSTQGNITIQPSDHVTIALFSGWASILVTNFFGFSVVIIQLFLFLFPAFLIVISSFEKPLTYRRIALPLSPVLTAVISGSVGVVGLLFIVRLAASWYADMMYATGYRYSRTGQYDSSRTFLARAIALSPSEPLFHDEMSTTLASLAVSAIEEHQDATSAADLAEASMKENEQALTISPRNVNFWKTRTKIFYSFSSFNPQLNQAAIQALISAQSLSPTDPKILYNLAVLSGRDGDNGRGIDYLKQAIDMKSNYRDAYYALFVFYTDTKNIPEARNTLNAYLTNVDPNDQDFQERLKQL